MSLFKQATPPSGISEAIHEMLRTGDRSFYPAIYELLIATGEGGRAISDPDWGTEDFKQYFKARAKHASSFRSERQSDGRWSCGKALEWLKRRLRLRPR